MKDKIIAHIDGASRGNPGPAAYAVVVEREGGGSVAELSKRLGVATNNVAEYRALLAALEFALDRQFQNLKVVTDSELLARQLQGRYKVKSPDLRPLYDEAREMICRFEAFSVEHVPREKNREADRLANQALDGHETKSGPPLDRS
jgi:ribonuclease HI